MVEKKILKKKIRREEKNLRKKLCLEENRGLPYSPKKQNFINMKSIPHLIYIIILIYRLLQEIQSILGPV